MKPGRLQWHMLKCPDAKPMFHCKHDHTHFFLTEAEREIHSMECDLVHAMDSGSIAIESDEWK